MHGAVELPDLGAGRNRLGCEHSATVYCATLDLDIHIPAQVLLLRVDFVYFPPKGAASQTNWDGTVFRPKAFPYHNV